MAYLPGKDLIGNRLPNQEWFSLDEAAHHSGWGRTFIRDRVKDGTLPSQKFQGESKRRAVHLTYRVHRDELVLFILRNGQGHYREEKPFRDVAMIVRQWPGWMQRELVKFVNQSLSGDRGVAPKPEAGTEPASVSLSS